MNVLYLLTGLLVAANVGAQTRAERLKDLLVRLVRTPSVNGEQHEIAVANEIVRFAHAEGCESHVLYAHNERPVVLVFSGPPAEGLVVVAHTDTVSAEPVGAWTHPPFAGVVEGDRLYGRGAADCKAGVVAGLAAVLMAKDAKLSSPITLLCVPDEESGATGELGVKILNRNNVHLGRAGAIYAYAGAEKLVIGHRGVWRFTLKVVGRSQHTGGGAWQNGSREGNIIFPLASLARDVELINEEFKDFGQGLFAEWRTVITPTKLEAGQSFGMVPSVGLIQVDVRTTPQTDVEAVRSAVMRKIQSFLTRHPDLKVTSENNAFIPPTEISATEPVVSALRDAVARETGKTLRTVVSGPANESYLLNEMGLPTVVFGPEGGNVHGPNEWVSLDSVIQTGRIFFEVHRDLTEPGRRSGSPKGR